MNLQYKKELLDNEIHALLKEIKNMNNKDHFAKSLMSDGRKDMNYCFDKLELQNKIIAFIDMLDKAILDADNG